MKSYMVHSQGSQQSWQGGDCSLQVTALGKKKKESQNWYCGSPPMVTNREADQPQHT